MSDELPPPSPYRIEQMMDNYRELQEMEQQLKITEMIINYLASSDFLLVILTICIGIAIVKSVKVIDKKINGSDE